MEITERKQAEEGLIESEKRLKREQALSNAIIDSIPGTFYMLDESGRYARWNSYQRDEIVGKPDDLMTVTNAADTIHPDDRALIGDRIANVLGNGIVETVEGRVLLRGGPAFRWLLMTGRQMKIDGRPFLVGIGIDITERKQAEEKLVAGHKLLSNLASLVPGVIYQYRLYPDGRSAFPYASQTMNDIYEVTPEEVREDATPVFGRLHPDDHDRVAADILESARTLETFYCEFRVILPRQGLRWRWSQAQPERLDDGSTLWHGIISDITERKRAEEEQAKLEAQLNQAQRMESVGRLAGGVAHDFNNMLGVIIGHAEIAMDQIDPDQPLHADLQEIRNAANRSADLTRQLLAFARKQVISPKVLDINETVEGMLKMLRRLIGEDIHLTWLPGANLWPVRVDPSQIDQILANLCINARDAIAGVGKLTIETGNISFDEGYCTDHADFVPGDFVLLVVSDNGCGMDKKTIDKIFEPFFTTKEVGKGTGLGLATVYGIVKQNNGFINVYSELGQGTTFRIYLPRHAGATEEKRTEAGAAQLKLGQETILLVEDELVLLELNKFILERLGYQVLAAGTPGEAIRLAEEYTGEIHLLMTDVVMPEMNGQDLARKMMSLSPHLKCLFTSGYTADVIAHHGVLDEGVHFIQKPFSRKDLATKIREVLDQK